MSNRIRFGEPIEPKVPQEEPPPDLLLAGGAGKWRRASFQVYIVQSVYADIWNHVNETPTIESGGVLVGHPFKTFDGLTTFVVVTAAIPQRSDNRSLGHFTVGPDEIADARKEMEREYPGLVVVGWYHSHPGHGVFLSGQDMTIVHSIYNAPWHIAVVVDPQRRTEGIFVGPEGEQLGGRGNNKLEQNWIGLRDVPDSVHAIAIYNQAQERLNEARAELGRYANKLQNLIENSTELGHWRERGGYRDIAEILVGLSEKGRQRPIGKKRPGEIPWSPPPESIRRRRPGCSSGHWLALSAVLAAAFGVFAVAASFLSDDLNSWITLGLGTLLGVLAVVLAGRVVFSRAEFELGQPDARGTDTRMAYLARERIAALALVGLVLILWAGYGISRSNLSIIVMPSATSTPTNTSTPTKPTNIPTFTATSAPSPTSTRTPTLTSTPTPTNTPTWTPTPKAVIPPVNDSILPTPVPATFTPATSPTP